MKLKAVSNSFTRVPPQDIFTFVYEVSLNSKSCLLFVPKPRNNYDLLDDYYLKFLLRKVYILNNLKKIN